MTTEKPKNEYKIEGAGHVWAAFTYSLDGLKRLWQEQAFRHATMLYLGCNVLYLIIGAPLWAFFMLAMVFFLVGAIESLNTAVEELVDFTSPEISKMGKHAKDLGSLAVMFCLLAGGVLSIYVIIASFS